MSIVSEWLVFTLQEFIEDKSSNSDNICRQPHSPWIGKVIDNSCRHLRSSLHMVQVICAIAGLLASKSSVPEISSTYIKDELYDSNFSLLDDACSIIRA